MTQDTTTLQSFETINDAPTAADDTSTTSKSSKDSKKMLKNKKIAPPAAPPVAPPVAPPAVDKGQNGKQSISIDTLQKSSALSDSGVAGVSPLPTVRDSEMAGPDVLTDAPDSDLLSAIKTNAAATPTAPAM